MREQNRLSEDEQRRDDAERSVEAEEQSRRPCAVEKTRIGESHDRA
jgi:hypothetical protein